ncbi:MAG: M4 family metallopeptidase [candidate division KSB1 bacterium]|nr:M4 family metallopeptidase [candidate division KSB1 bacterium]MDZ7304138.1 M4 family metallopeptidase [candidate division KSB1 bacterium]MDZ7314094.1 M4 family metallopeptidase [candidate division KSB1 bacterium]
MCQRTFHRHSIFCFLPPYILRSISQNGTAQQRAKALQTLSTDNTLRALRAAQAPVRLPAAGRGVSIEGQKHRIIYNVHNTFNLPGEVIRKEGAKPTGDVAADEAYDALGATFDFYWEVYDRNSIDDEGMPLKASVHFGQNYNNAFWDGQSMVFGDGDGDFFNRFTIALEVVGHELTHGVIWDEAQLQYFFQAGALNESMADVFGSLVKQYLLKQTADQADWLIGAGLFTRKVQGVALRSMKEPGTAFDDPVLGKDPQPAHMKDFVRTFEDNGGVHINSGIPNHAFYLAATNIGGQAWKKAGRIWYESLKDRELRSNSGFVRFAKLTARNAGRLYGANSLEAQAVREAWSQVGIKSS